MGVNYTNTTLHLSLQHLEFARARCQMLCFLCSVRLLAPEFLFLPPRSLAPVSIFHLSPSQYY